MKCRLGYVDCLLLGPGRFLGIRRKESSSQAGGGDGEQTHSLPLLLTESHCFSVARYLSEEEVLDTENPFVQLLSGFCICAPPQFNNASELDVRGGPAVKTLGFRCRWHGCYPGWGNSSCCAVQPKRKKKMQVCRFPPHPHPLPRLHFQSTTNSELLLFLIWCFPKFNFGGWQ